MYGSCFTFHLEISDMKKGYYAGISVNPYQ